MKFTKERMLEAMGLKVGDILVNPQVVYVVTDDLKLLNIKEVITYPLYFAMGIELKVVRNQKVQDEYFNYKIKFTNEMLAKAMGLKVEDKFKIKGINNIYKLNKDFEALDITSNIIYYLYDVCFLGKNDFEYEILSAQKVGDTKCKEYNYCQGCPLQCIHCSYNDEEQTLYEILKQSKIETVDQELYDFLEKRLNKEIKKA